MDIPIHIPCRDPPRPARNLVGGAIPEFPCSVAEQNHDTSGFIKAPVCHGYVKMPIPVEVGNRQTGGIYPNSIAARLAKRAVAVTEEDSHNAIARASGFNND